MPSGKNIQDFVDHVNGSMWALRSQQRTKKSSRRSSTWVFGGYVAFLLYASPELVDDEDCLQARSGPGCLKIVFSAHLYPKNSVEFFLS